MKENTEQVLKWILEDEGKYTDKHGLGGATNWGISFQFYKECLAKEDVTATIEGLKRLTQFEASQLYETYLFPQINFDDLPDGLDYVMANTAVMEGPTGAMKLLEQETSYEGETLWEPAPVRLAAGILLRQANIKLHDWRVEEHGPGWGNRMMRVWNRTLELINK